MVKIKNPIQESAMATLEADLHANQYTKLAVGCLQGKVPATDEATKQAVRRLLREFNPNATPQCFDQVWQQLEPRLNNPGLAKFMLDYGARSEFFAPWLLKVPQAITLEVAFGYAADINGQWRQIPESDEYHNWLGAPMFRFIRERVVREAQELCHAKKALILGAGYLPGLRHVGLTQTDWPEYILACDSDSRVDWQRFFDYNDVATIDYRITDMWELLRDSANEEQFDLVSAQGVLSYQYDQLGEILFAAVETLKSGGKLMFDLQLKHWDLVRDAFVFGWRVEGREMTLPESYQEAYDHVLALCRKYELPVAIDYWIDSCCPEEPTGIGLVLTKF